MFVGRQEELNILEKDYYSKKSNFCIVYGRRRIGKSTLLRNFSESHPYFYFLGGKDNKQKQINRFIHELSLNTGDKLIDKMKITDWQDVFDLLDRSIEKINEKSGKKIIVFDEFQWMCNNSEELLTSLQYYWDTKWKDRKDIFLILCGSSVSFMLGKVLSESSPLFGRRTRSINLLPFNISESAEFFKNRNIFEIAEIFMITGGVAKYLEIFSSGESFISTVKEEILTRTGYFFDEVQFVLSEQLKEKDKYFRILIEMSKTPIEITELERITMIASGQITYYLERLMLLGFISRHIPFGKSNSSKTVKYKLEDYFLKFYFRFIHNSRQSLILGSSQSTYPSLIKEKWNTFVGTQFEQIVHDHATIITKKANCGEIIEIGSFWQKPTKLKQGFQIDLIIKTDSNIMLICECKWSRKKIGLSVVKELQRKIELFQNKDNLTIKPVIISAAGVTSAVKKEKSILTVDLNEYF